MSFIEESSKIRREKCICTHKLIMCTKFNNFFEIFFLAQRGNVHL